ncbi:hypothetical protein A3852_17895 [Rhodococcus qingshengii]|nr:hypothetical protein A3852_17895 [Rhodococcus qingshengii]
MFVNAHEGDLLAVRSTSGWWKHFDVSRGWVDRKNSELSPEFENSVEREWQRRADEAKEKADAIAAENVQRGSDELKEARAFARTLDAWAQQCGNRPRVEAAIALGHNRAQRLGFAVDPDEFDSTPELFGVLNGVINIATGELIQRSRDVLVTKSAACDYQQNATHPEWTSYLDTFLPDREYRKFVQKVLGYAALLKGNPDRLLVLLLGDTSTGKSALKEVIRTVLGDDYATTVDPSFFREKREAGATAELSTALYARFAEMSESGVVQTLHASLLKRLTGNETVGARLPHSPVLVQKIPDFTPVIATNKMPLIPDADAALQRRILVLPFDHQIEDSMKKASPHENSDVWPAVLAWLVEGYQAYKAEGLIQANWHDDVKKASAASFRELSPFDGWWNERIVIDPEEWTSGAELRADISWWQENEGVEHERRVPGLVAAQKISKSKGFKSAVRNGVRGVRGLKLRPRPSENEA